MEKTSAATKPAAHDETKRKIDATTTGRSDITDHQRLFAAMALEMSWQLAVAVLLPVIGGFALDSKLHTTPLLTFLGLFMAFAGVCGILRRTLKEANRRIGGTTPDPKGKA